MFRISLIPFLLVFLSACASDGMEWDGVSCPDVGAVGIATTYTALDGSYSVTMDRVRGACDVDDGRIETDITLKLDARNLGNVELSDVTLPLFSVILGLDDQVLRKDMHSAVVKIPPSNGLVSENFKEIVIKFTPEDLVTPVSAYHIVVGFQLNEQQIEEE